MVKFNEMTGGERSGLVKRSLVVTLFPVSVNPGCTSLTQSGPANHAELQLDGKIFFFSTRSSRHSLTKHILSFSLAINLLLAGCTVGNHGTLIAKYTTTDTVTVLDVYSVGFQVRPTGVDLGATLGYRHATYVFSNTDTLDPTGLSDWHWFNSPWPSGELVMRGNSSLGVEMQATEQIGRLTVGYINQLITVGPAPGESKIVRLYYNRKRPKETYLYLKLEEGDSER